MKRRASVIVLLAVAGLLLAGSGPSWAAPDGVLNPPNPLCVIKGNVSDNGDRVYHLPGDPWYAKTRINIAKGERWFCSELEAIKSGWRAPKK